MQNLNNLKRQVAIFVLTGLSCLIAGCGGSSSSQNSPTSNTTPTAPTPNTPTPSTPSPTPAPTATSPGAYMATMFLLAEGSSAPPRGTVNVNAQADNGSGTLQISGGQPSASYELQFCSGGQPPSTSARASTPTAPMPAAPRT